MHRPSVISRSTEPATGWYFQRGSRSLHWFGRILERHSRIVAYVVSLRLARSYRADEHVLSLQVELRGKKVAKVRDTRFSTLCARGCKSENRVTPDLTLFDGLHRDDYSAPSRRRRDDILSHDVASLSSCMPLYPPECNARCATFDILRGSIT